MKSFHDDSEAGVSLSEMETTPDGTTINLAAKVTSTTSEGPGRRFAVWVQGCPMRCAGCCNPDFLEFKEADRITADALADEILATDGIEGLTLLGGEPFAQAPALAALARRCRGAGLSVMAFSGYTLEHLRRVDGPGWSDLLGELDLLVDGPYVASLHTTERRWIGSTNQRVHFLTERYAPMAEDREGWDRSPNTLEIRLVGTELVVNGFPDPDLNRWLGSIESRSSGSRPSGSEPRESELRGSKP